MGKRLAALTGLVLVFLLAATTVAAAEPVVTTFKFGMMPSVTGYGASSHIGAALLASGSPLPSKRIVLQRSLNGSTWTTVTTMFSTTGSYATDVTVIERTQYRLLFRGDEKAQPATSSVCTVTSRAYLTAPAIAGRVYKGKALGAVGYLKPRHLAGKQWVTLEAEQWVNGAWKPIKSYATSTADNYSYSKYSQSLLLPYTGNWRIRAVHADGNHAKTVTGWAYTTVVPDPTMRWSGGSAGLSTPWFPMKKGSHRYVATWQSPDDGYPHSFQVTAYIPTITDAPRPARPTPIFLVSQYFGSSGSQSGYLTLDRDTQVYMSVAAAEGVTWTLTLVP